MIDRLYEEADKIWHTEEVLPLQRQVNVDSDSKLKETLAEEGRSFDNMRSPSGSTSWRRRTSRKNKGPGKGRVPDLLRYYNEHYKNTNSTVLPRYLARAGCRG